LVKSQLTDIKGIGPATTDQLLKKFRSVKRIKEAGFNAWVDEIGLAKSQLLKGYFDELEKK